MSVTTGCIRCGILPYSAELDHLRVDQDQLAPRRAVRVISRLEDDRVQADRLAGAGAAGDQQVRHVGEVVDERPAFAVLAEEERELRLGDLRIRRRRSLP